MKPGPWSPGPRAPVALAAAVATVAVVAKMAVVATGVIATTTAAVAMVAFAALMDPVRAMVVVEGVVVVAEAGATIIRASDRRALATHRLFGAFCFVRRLFGRYCAMPVLAFAPCDREVVNRIGQALQKPGHTSHLPWNDAIAAAPVNDTQCALCELLR